ncbi:hypothetical protein FZC79_13915 [Rossellomorea vietnamensis]|uniref:Uncharacterized protein n=2 Tax=Rossellomorea TaxID=2837508 RepID=A0A5D4KB72_9BACI|nr:MULTISPECIES: hypothetical protein [Rossellomorea]TYR74568.1 hypothetical protein FZC79_13915 [Rossellomorea vietnamensis]TYS75129.1 hypothetical protein FZC80_18310 [Rossellomorea aquimaris]
MKKSPPCPCGCGKNAYACKPPLSVRVSSRPFNTPEERAEIIENVEACSTFRMRMRGHFLFYGKDLAAYVKTTTVTPNTTPFLHRFSNYLYEKCDSGTLQSWEDCGHHFWDEFISAFCPHHLPLSHKEKETEKFLFQLTKFANWLDIHTNSATLPIITSSIKTHKPQLKLSEKITNHLLKKHFPTILSKNWNYSNAIHEFNTHFERCQNIADGLFEVTGSIDKIVLAAHLETNKIYHIRGLPAHLLQSPLLIHGVIGKGYKEKRWNWIFTSGAYPMGAKEYLLLHMETAQSSPYLDTWFWV